MYLLCVLNLCLYHICSIIYKSKWAGWLCSVSVRMDSVRMNTHSINTTTLIPATPRTLRYLERPQDCTDPQCFQFPTGRSRFDPNTWHCLQSLWRMCVENTLRPLWWQRLWRLAKNKTGWGWGGKQEIGMRPGRDKGYHDYGSNCEEIQVTIHSYACHWLNLAHPQGCTDP